MEIPCAKVGISDWLTAARPIGYLRYIATYAAWRPFFRRGPSGDWRSRDRVSSSKASWKRRLKSRTTQPTPYPPGRLSTSYNSMVYAAPRLVCRSETRECGNKTTTKNPSPKTPDGPETRPGGRCQRSALSRRRWAITQVFHGLFRAIQAVYYTSS